MSAGNQTQIPWKSSGSPYLMSCPGISFYRLHRLSVMFHWGPSETHSKMCLLWERRLLKIQAIVWVGEVVSEFCCLEVGIQPGMQDCQTPVFLLYPLRVSVSFCIMGSHRMWPCLDRLWALDLLFCRAGKPGCSTPSLHLHLAKRL